MTTLIVFNLCAAGLFLCLLEDRFRLWTTLAVLLAVTLLSIGVEAFLQGSFQTGLPGRLLPALSGAILFFGVSLFLFRNNFLQKLFLALLAMADHLFLTFALPLMLGLLPTTPSGGLGGFLPLAAEVLFTLLMGLCLYRPVTHFRDRGPSGFPVGMCLLAALISVFSLQLLDFLFRTNIPAARLASCAGLYLVILFCFRSLYHAGRFRQRATMRSARGVILQAEMDSVEELFSAVREVKTAEKAGEYALDTIQVMVSDGLVDKIPQYIRMAKENMVSSPILGAYHEHPALNAIIAARAAFAKQNDIAFECNVVTEGSPLTTGELCLVCGEILSRACRDAANFQGPRKVRFTVFPSQELLRFEAVYSGLPPGREKLSLKKVNAAELFRKAFEELPRDEDDLPGLDTTRDLIMKTSGSLSLSSSGENEMLLQASFRK